MEFIQINLGQEAIAVGIYKSLLKHYTLLTDYSYLSIQNNNITMNGGLSNYRINNINNIFIADLTFTFSEPYDYTFKTKKIDLGEYSLNYLLPYNEYISLPIECLIYLKNDKYINTIGQLIFSSNKHLYLELQLIDPTTNKTYNHIDIKNIAIKSTNFNIIT